VVGSPAAANNINTGVVNVTNNGLVISTLTLNNLRPTDSGSYQLMAVNTTNIDAAPSYTSFSQLVVDGGPAPVNNMILDYAGQTFHDSTNYVPSWPADSSDLNLIAGSTNGSGPGTFTYSGDFSAGGACNADPTVLTDGLIGTLTSVPTSAYCACGRQDYGAGYMLTYTLKTNAATYGFDLTNITVFGGWPNSGRIEQKYQLLYSTVEAPTNFVPLTIADYLPADPDGSAMITRTMLIPASGVLARNVACVSFDFGTSPPPLNGWEGYDEILVGGTPSTGLVPPLINDVSPNTASDVVGGQIILTASFANYSGLQWVFNGTNNVAGATTSTLTLNNLTLNNSGAYSLVASNASGGSSSSACVVTVQPVPAPVSNIVASVATQTSLEESFMPTWATNELGGNLLYQGQPSTACCGSFQFPDGNNENAGTPAVLTDGSFGTINFGLTGDNYDETCIGQDAEAGNYVIYTLAGSTNGYDLTSIMSAGGWSNNGRDQEEYTLSYSTVADPTNFIELTVVNYNTVNPVGISVTRVTLTPATGILAGNVAALMFDMRSPGGKNGYEGYSELAAYGSASGPLEMAPSVSCSLQITPSGNLLVFTGTNGYPLGSSYTLLSTTNLSAPITWTTNTTGVLDGTGSFSNAIPINSLQNDGFFRVRIP